MPFVVEFHALLRSRLRRGRDCHFCVFIIEGGERLDRRVRCRFPIRLRFPMHPAGRSPQLPIQFVDHVQGIERGDHTIGVDVVEFFGNFATMRG